ncbi:ComEC/Rec2 family competence protein, partial [Streptomyces nigra]
MREKGEGYDHRRDEGRHGTRAAVHAASGGRLGAAHPRQEGPTDLRLVPPALAAWATSAVTLDAAPAWVTGTAVGCLVVAGVLMTLRVGRMGRMGRVGRARRVPGARTGGRSGWPAVTAAAVLVCVAAAAVSAGLHGADLRRGPLPGLAERYATVIAEAEITSDPRLVRPRVRGPAPAPTAVLFEADVRRVEMRDGATVMTRTPVLMVVDVERRRSSSSAFSASSAGDRPSPWLTLLPSTRVRVTARVVPPADGGDIAAVLRVRDPEVPEVVGEPSAAQRLAGRLRAGLREATDGLAPDARALLPGLVVGDTARITPELDEAFKETDLAHTLAVSGSNLTIILVLLVGPPGLAQRVERRGLAPRLGISLRTTALLGGALTLGFVIVCRPDPSVLRAAACGAVALLALATGRRRSLIPALATAVLLLVLYDPWLSRSYGFLLSVLATGALLTLAPRWSAALRARRVPPRLA